MFHEIISCKNLFDAWEEFKRGKRMQTGVCAFERHLEKNIFDLYGELRGEAYRHGPYEQFRIDDPKPRLISKASVRDRVVHRAIHRVLYPAVDSYFIYASYASRIGKGTHRAFWRARTLLRAMSRNHTRTCFVLQCDIRKFFDTVDHAVLVSLVENTIKDKRAVDLLWGIIRSFHTLPGKGMPLGNLTSQLFANMYMDPLDKFITHGLGISSYVRYADDFLIVTDDTRTAWDIASRISRF